MTSPSQYYRAGVGAVIVNKDDLILTLERASIKHAWQLPQGGLESSENPLIAAFREVNEETGITEADLKLLDTYPELLVYELPRSAWSHKTGRGQVQSWFLFRFLGKDRIIDVRSGGEFSTWKWASFQALLNDAVDFRKPVYEKLAERFGRHVAGLE